MMQAKDVNIRHQVELGAQAAAVPENLEDLLFGPKRQGDINIVQLVLAQVGFQPVRK